MNRAEAFKLIDGERERHVSKGWTISHNSGHTEGELRRAVTCYYNETMGTSEMVNGVPTLWPFDHASWKPRTERENLVRAGSFMLAEFNRLQRDNLSTDHLNVLWEKIVDSITKIDLNPHRPSVPDMLTKLGDIHRERGKVYGDNYKHFGKIMALLFPKGLSLEKPIDYDRLAMLVHIQSKITRYAQNLMVNKTGHKDSLDDAAVYLMMLQELDSLWEAQNGKN